MVWNEICKDVEEMSGDGSENRDLVGTQSCKINVQSYSGFMTATTQSVYPSKGCCSGDLSELKRKMTKLKFFSAIMLNDQMNIPYVLRYKSITSSGVK